MTRMSVALVVAGAVSVAGCSQSPVSPSAAQGGLSSTAARGPSSSGHTLAFTEPGDPGDSSGYILGSGSVTGWITGWAGSGNLLAHATSNDYWLTITGTSVAPGGTPAQDVECTDPGSILYTSELIGTAIHGTLTVDVDQDGSKSNTDPTMDWELSGVQDNDSRTWRIRGISTNNYPPHGLSGGVDDKGAVHPVGVSVNHMKVLFSRLVTSGRKTSTDLSYGCRVDVQMTMTPQ